MTFKQTEEQLAIIDAAREFKKLKINAKAGTGKTSTLVMVAKDQPVKSLYLAFNKNMAEEARDKFPSHVEVRTTHSLAYSQTGVAIAHKLRRPPGGYTNVCGTGSEIAKHFKMAPFVVTPERSISATAMGYAVKSTVSRFEYSSDREIMRHHVSFTEAEKVIKHPEFNKEEYAGRVLRIARRLWDMRIDANSPILATHDTYLKLFQLSNPDLSCFEMIYLDEAQDSNACLLDIVLNQNGSVILVGDSYQSIYGWRGSVNAMEQVHWEERELTKSFRFGQAVADVANKILMDEGGRVVVNIKGFEKLDTKVIDHNTNEHYTWLFRTNAEMLGNAVELILQGKKINVQADISDFINLMESVIALQSDRKKDVKHIDVIPFDNWQELNEEVEVTSSAELKRVHKQVMDGTAYRILNTLKTYKPAPDALITLSSAHKSKGLEYDNVVLAGDFKGIEFDEAGRFVGFENPQERNLLYVAATRAKKTLVINSQIEDIIYFIESNQEDQPDTGLEINIKSVVAIDRSEADLAILKDSMFLETGNLDKLVKQKMASMGFMMNDMDEFIEGDPDDVEPEDEHWTNMEMRA